MSVEKIVSKLNGDVLGSAAMKTESMTKPASQGSSFKDMLAQMDSGMEFAEQVGANSNTNMMPVEQMQSLEGNNVQFAVGTDMIADNKSTSSQKVLDMLGEVNKNHMQMDSVVNHILYSGKKFSNQELLVIQAHVFQFAQMTELTVKVAEHGVSSVKAVLNTQVQ